MTTTDPEPNPDVGTPRETVQVPTDATTPQAPRHLMRLQGREPQASLASDAYTYLALLATLSVDSDTHVPTTYAEAMRRLDLWKPAIEDELRVMEDRKVWCLIPEDEVPAGKKTVGCH